MLQLRCGAGYDYLGLEHAAPAGAPGGPWQGLGFQGLSTSSVAVLDALTFAWSTPRLQARRGGPGRA